MPNWCSTAIAFIADEKDAAALQQLKDLNDLFLNDPPAVQEKASGDWIGNWLPACGIDPNAISCRSFVQAVDEGFEQAEGIRYFKMYTEDAWGPKFEALDALVRCERFCRLRYVLLAEEPANGVYVNTDVEHLIFPEAYKLDYEVVDKETGEPKSDVLYFSDLEEYLAAVKDIFGIESLTFDDAWAQLVKQGEADPDRFVFASVGKFEP